MLRDAEVFGSGTSWPLRVAARHASSAASGRFGRPFGGQLEVTPVPDCPRSSAFAPSGSIMCESRWCVGKRSSLVCPIDAFDSRS